MQNMKIDFNNKRVLVTGATRGIGRQIADDLYALGAELILTGTDKERVADLNNEAASAGRERVSYLAVDFTDSESTNVFLEEIKEIGRIDVCINNAGINRINYIDETRVEDYDDIMAVNLKAPFLIIRALSLAMKANGYGRIVNISSIFGVISKEKRSVYSASKFGLHGVTVSASNELSRHNVLVNTVSPGFVLTDLTRSILSEAEMAELEAAIPLGRLAEPADIASVVIFLASSLNTYITGQNIIVDGGYVNV